MLAGQLGLVDIAEKLLEHGASLSQGSDALILLQTAK
jgi:hypothetical protein